MSKQIKTTASTSTAPPAKDEKEETLSTGSSSSSGSESEEKSESEEESESNVPSSPPPNHSASTSVNTSNTNDNDSDSDDDDDYATDEENDLGFDADLTLHGPTNYVILPTGARSILDPTEFVRFLLSFNGTTRAFTSPFPITLAEGQAPTDKFMLNGFPVITRKNKGFKRRMKVAFIRGGPMDESPSLALYISIDNVAYVDKRGWSDVRSNRQCFVKLPVLDALDTEEWRRLASVRGSFVTWIDYQSGTVTLNAVWNRT